MAALNPAENGAIKKQSIRQPAIEEQSIRQPAIEWIEPAFGNHVQSIAFEKWPRLNPQSKHNRFEQSNRMGFDCSRIAIESTMAPFGNHVEPIASPDWVSHSFDWGFDCRKMSDAACGKGLQPSSMPQERAAAQANCGATQQNSTANAASY